MTPEQIARRKELLDAMHELSLSAMVYESVKKVALANGEMETVEEMEALASGKRRELLPLVTEYQELAYG